MAINLRKTVNKEKLKAKFEAEAAASQGSSDFLPYFKLKNKDTITLRFLSDANPNNQDFFLYTEEVFNFNGKNMKFNGPSKDCPASKIAAKLFAEAKAAGEDTPEGKELREQALKFYKKRKYLANVYIVDAPEYFWIEAGLDPDKIEDRVKVISLPKKVYDTIKDAVMDDDFEDVEFYNFGDNVVNFKLTVKKNAGGFNDYSASKFEIKPKELNLTDEEIDIIAKQLKDLSTIFKVYSLDEFNEAIAIELNGENDDEDETPVVKKKITKNSSIVDEDEIENDENEDQEDEEVKPKKDIKKLRKGILSRLKIEEDA